MRRNALLLIAGAVAIAATFAVLCVESEPSTHHRAVEQPPLASQPVAMPVMVASAHDSDAVADRREAAPIAASVEAARKKPRRGTTLRASGRVIDELGKPIANASVHLLVAVDCLWIATTDGDGRFECWTETPIERGWIEVHAQDRPETSTGTLELPVSDLELCCRPGGRIRGSISLEHRCRIADLHLSFHGARGPTSAEKPDISVENGEFATEFLVAGFHSIDLVGNGFVLLHVPDVAIVEGQDTFDARLQQIRLEQLTRNVQFRVQDAGGHPIDDVGFGEWMGRARDYQIEARPMSAGRYRFRVPTLGASVPIHAYGWRLRIEPNVREDRVVTLEPAFALKLVLRSRPDLDPQDVSLTLRRRSGRPYEIEASARFSSDGTVSAFVDEPGEHQLFVWRSRRATDDDDPQRSVSIHVQPHTDEQVFELDAP